MVRSLSFAWSCRRTAALAAGLLLAGCGGAGGGTIPIGGQSPPPLHANLTRVSMDPFQNGGSQHATEVEPSLFAAGSTIVAAFQAGRFFQAGASDIGYATSHDNGATWIAGFLPGITNVVSASNPFDSVSDPVVAYDARHTTWLIASLPVKFNSSAGGAAVSRSADGNNWSNPVFIDMGDGASDKTWITCDNTSSSPFYGHCYLEFDEGGTTGIIHMITSTDGGATWGPILNTAGNASGIGGQPLVQPNGTVIVPIDDFNETTVLSFVSHDGGASWTAPVIVSPINDHFEAASLRSGPLPSAAIDAAGKVYVVWQDCSFRPGGCTTNDLVMTTSTDGLSWSPLARIPIDPVSSSVDHFLPGVGVAPGTAGAGAQIGLTYYYYPASACGADTCQLFAGFIGSTDGGTTWGMPNVLAGPMSISWLPRTMLGPMVGDYFATVFAGGQPVGIFAVADPPSFGLLQQAMYVPKPGTLTLRSALRRSSVGERPIPGVHSDHALRTYRHRIP